MAFRSALFLLGLSAAAAAPAEVPSYTLVPSGPNHPGPAPKFGAYPDRMGDADFFALARVQTIEEYMKDVDEWLHEVQAAGDEPLDIEDSGLEPDDELFGRKRKWGR